MAVENDFAGLGDGVWRLCSADLEVGIGGEGRTAFGLLVELKAAVIDQVLHHGLGGGGGIGFAIGQPVAQIGLAMALEERPARIFGRPHAPFFPHPTAFPNVSFHVFNNFSMVDRHGCLPPAFSCLPLVTHHSSLFFAASLLNLKS